MNQPTLHKVNAAVLAVLAEMGSARRSVPSQDRNPIPPDVFAERLFALRHAEAIEPGVKEVRVVAGTVITPLARDLLKRRQIGITLVSGREAALSRSRQRGEWGFAIAARSGQAVAFQRLLLGDDAWSEVGSDVVAAARWVIAAEGRGALVVAEEASLATWQANRIEGVRAATVEAVDAVSRAVRHLGVNLLVVEPAGKSIFLLKQLGEKFRQGGAPCPPAGLAEGEPETESRFLPRNRVSLRHAGRPS